MLLKQLKRHLIKLKKLMKILEKIFLRLSDKERNGCSTISQEGGSNSYYFVISFCSYRHTINSHLYERKTAFFLANTRICIERTKKCYQNVTNFSGAS